MISWIQTHILYELIRHKTRRYSELRPRDVESNLFMYHLKGLIKDGLVEKTSTVYTLSDKGLQYVGMMSLETGKTRLQPKILTTVMCRNERDEYLFVEWCRQPNINQVSFPHGMVHFGESIVSAAKRELMEKAGIMANVVYRGDVYIRGVRGEEVDRHMLAHVFEATNMREGDKKQIRLEVSEPFWAPLENIKADEYVPGFYELAKVATTRSDHFFEEIEVTIT